MSESNKQVLRRWFDEVWNNGRAEVIDELFAADGIAHGLSDEMPMKGPADYKPFYQQFRSAFPDISVVVEDMIAEGDRVAARCSVRGKHTSDSFGVTATNSPVEFTGITIVRIANGQIVEAWNNFDFMRLFRQIGAL
jgi:steroid delta-isomerase-like uncharacterized protein